MKRIACGDGFIAAVKEAAVFDTLSEILAGNINYLLAEAYPSDRLDRHFEAHDMVAL
jgi:hypothetical protein